MTLAKGNRKNPRLKFTEEELADPTLKKPIRQAEQTANQAEKAHSNVPRKRRYYKNRTVDPDTGQVTVRLPFEETERKKSSSALKQTAVAAPLTLTNTAFQRRVRDEEDDNAGVESAHQVTQVAEHGVHVAQHSIRSAQLRPGRQAERAERRLEETNLDILCRPEASGYPRTGSNPTSRWRQKQNIKKQYYAMRGGTNAAASFGGATHTAEIAATGTKQTVSTLQQVVRRRRHTFLILIGLLFMVGILLTQLQSCSVLTAGALSAVSATSWPADDVQITKADAYYTKLEAQLQKRINDVERDYSDCDEFTYDLAPIGHDPAALISYLSAKYGAFTFRQVKEELNDLFAMQYALNVSTTERNDVTTRTVRLGEPLGTVVTSGYCNCEICCGRWSGGPTASGVYPAANHTLAVDAYNPIVPIGTEIIMNGVLYKVEDTGNLNHYGVDFDVYYNDHRIAQMHGHRNWTAYYAGGSGEEVTVQTASPVKVCNVKLTASDFYTLLENRLDNEAQQELYQVYTATHGNRTFFHAPINGTWQERVSTPCGYRVSPTNGRVEEYHGMDIEAGRGVAVFVVMDGKVKSVSGSTIVLENDKGYQMKYGGCAMVRVTVGQEVRQGDRIASVNSEGYLHLEFTYHFTHFNPYFYLKEDGSH